MRLVGGNIGDSPVKNVRDGSAFAAAGGGAPDLVVVGTVPATGTQITQFDESLSHNQNGGVPGAAKYTVKWSDNSFGCFWCSGTSPYKLYYNHVTTNADGTFAACATKVDLSGDLVGAATDQKMALSGVKLSASRVVIHISFQGPSSIWGQETLVYDKNSDSLTEHGTVFDHGQPGWNGSMSIRGTGVAAVNATQGIVFWNDVNASYTNMSGTPHHFTDTKTVGTARNVTAAQCDTQGGVAFSDNSDPAVIFTLNNSPSAVGNTLLEWDFTVGTTPQLAGSYAASKTGWTSPSGVAYGSVETQTDGSFDSGGGMAVSLINRNDIERGRFLSTLYNVGGPEVGFFAGVTTNKSINYDVVFLNVAGTHTGTTNALNSKMMEIDYDDATYWGRYLFVNVHNTGGLYLTPFNFNWSTFEFVRSPIADLPNRAASVTVTNGCWLHDTLIGSSSATNMCLIFNEAADDIRYINVPFTS